MSLSEEVFHPKRIIRGAFVEGVAFSHSSPKKHIEPSIDKPFSRPFNLRKELWKKITNQKLLAHEWQEVWQAGYEEGFRKGLHEGQKQGFDAGKEEGFEKGYREGVEKTKRDFESTLVFLQTLTKRLTEKKEEIYDQLKPEIIKFALAVCEKILRKELSHSQAFVDVIEHLVEQAKGILKESSAQIFVSPKDLQMLKHDAQTASKNHELLSSFEFIADPQMQRGNCRIETAYGLLNFDIKRLLNSLEEKVLGAKNHLD